MCEKTKILKNIYLVSPQHLTLVNDGHGEFPNSYKLTENGVNLILNSLKENINLLEIIKGEIELAEEPKEYSEKVILESIKALIYQNEL